MFAAGIVVGIGLTFVGQKLWRQTSVPPTAETAPIVVAEKITPAVTRSSPSANRAPAASAVAPNVTESALLADELTIRPDMPASTKATIYRLQRVMAFISFVAPPDRAARTARDVVSGTVTTVTRTRAELTLRGQMISETSDPLSVEFTVRRLDTGDGNNLTGVVRYLNRNDQAVGHQLEGRITNRILTLRETSTLGNVGGPWQSFPVGRTFVIQLPGTTIRDESEISGTWSLSAQSGTLLLKIASPW